MAQDLEGDGGELPDAEVLAQVAQHRQNARHPDEDLGKQSNRGKDCVNVYTSAIRQSKCRCPYIFVTAIDNHVSALFPVLSDLKVLQVLKYTIYVCLLGSCPQHIHSGLSGVLRVRTVKLSHMLGLRCPAFTKP